MNTLNRMIACAVLSTAWSSAVSAEQEAGPGAQAEWRYEGRLLERGVPVSGAFDLEFRVFDTAVDGKEVGPVLFAGAVPVEDGNFGVVLEFEGFPFDAARHWIEMSVDGRVLPPRQRLVRAFELDDSSAGAETDTSSDAPQDDAAAPNAPGGVMGRGHRSAPGGSGLEGLWAPGDPEDDGDEDEYPLTAQENFDGEGDPGDAGGGVWDTRGSEYYYKRANVGIGTSNPAYPLDVRNKSRSRTLNVDNSDGSGTRYGVYARAKSTSGRGVYGYASASSGSTIGVYGKTNSATGVAVYGLNAGNQQGQVAIGVHGESLATTGPGYGVFGRSSGSGNGSHYGLYGFSSGGASATNYGVVGEAGNGSSNYGVFGSASGNNAWAGWFTADVNVVGNLSKGGGSFRIDHPLDPENKYLYHSFVESPDMKNVYDGNVVTDADGYATITMPEWFETLNRDFRYQLTVIDEADGESFVMAKVVRGVVDNEFAIRTSEGWTRVSWQVTGIRQDAFANANRIPVEQDKLEQDRGAYLHPEAWGRPEAQRIGALEDPEPGE